MKRHEIGSSLFLVLLAILAGIGSLRLGIGTLHNPGTGFMAFGASLFLGFFGLALLLRAAIDKDDSKEVSSLFSGRLWKRVILVLVALLIYAKVMPLAGYLISTFLLMSFLFWIVKGQKWGWVLVSSFLSTLLTYYIFSKLFGGQFPEGLFGF